MSQKTRGKDKEGGGGFLLRAVGKLHNGQHERWRATRDDTNVDEPEGEWGVGNKKADTKAM